MRCAIGSPRRCAVINSAALVVVNAIRSTKSSPKRLNTRSAGAQHARQRKKKGGEINLLLFQQND
jgi:hypothetical protein